MSEHWQQLTSSFSRPFRESFDGATYPSPEELSMTVAKALELIKKGIQVGNRGIGTVTDGQVAAHALSAIRELGSATPEKRKVTGGEGVPDSASFNSLRFSQEIIKPSIALKYELLPYFARVRHICINCTTSPTGRGSIVPHSGDTIEFYRLPKGDERIEETAWPRIAVQTLSALVWQNSTATEHAEYRDLFGVDEARQGRDFAVVSTIWICNLDNNLRDIHSRNANALAFIEYLWKSKLP